MQPFEAFRGSSSEFWVFVKFISEILGYTERRKNTVKSYSEDAIKALCQENSIIASDEAIQKAIQYSDARAGLLNTFAEKVLMNAEEASEEFGKLMMEYYQNGYKCKIPLNKQSGEMKKTAYFTAIINILTEKTLRQIDETNPEIGFDDDPRRLAYLWNHNHELIGASSRRFDGAYPSIINPKMVWEIKEYYYATTFGSRVADGVYETQLDGFEFNEIFNRTGRKVYHVLFIDAYRTWWIQGKSYLCRIIDALNIGLVDEVIIGREVFTRWPEVIQKVVRSQS